MTHAHPEEKTAVSSRKGLFIGLGIAAVVAVTVAVLFSLFGGANKGFGAELESRALRDSLSDQMAESFNEDMCFVLVDKPKGLGEGEDAPSTLPAVNCLLQDGSPNGVSVTMVSDEGFAAAVNSPADGVELVELGESADGAHQLHYLAETGLIYDVTETSVLRYGPFGDDAAAREFAVSHGLLEGE